MKNPIIPPEKLKKNRFLGRIMCFISFAIKNKKKVKKSQNATI
jgi:hypothetical protein